MDFEKQTPEGDQDPVISTIIFEWRDEKFVGRYLTPDAISVWTVISSFLRSSDISYADVMVMGPERKSTFAMRKVCKPSCATPLS